MKQQLLSKLTAPMVVSGGTVYLYATRCKEGKPFGRLYPYQEIAEGGVVPPLCPVLVEEEQWACVLRSRSGVLMTPHLDSFAQEKAQSRFDAFVSSLAMKDQEARWVEERFLHQDERIMRRSFERLRGINRKLTGWSDLDPTHDDQLVEACNVLGKYLNVEIRVPAKDETGRKRTLVEEILQLSGIRHKPVCLDGHWWKRTSGVMLGTLLDGTPVTLLPSGMRGYKLYNPRTHTSTRMGEALADTLSPEALAVYRTFPNRPMGFREILRFALGEHIYLEIGIILLFSFFASMIQVLPPILSQQVFDTVVPEYLRGMLVQIVLILLAFECAGIGFSILVNLGFSRIKTKIELAVQAGIWDRLISMQIPFFFQFTSGELLEKIKSITQVKNALSLDLLKTFLSALFSFINVIVMWQYSPEITPWILLLFLACFLITAYVGRRKYKLNQRYTEVSNRAASLQQQMVEGIQRIQASRAQTRAYGMWSGFETEERFLKSRIKMLDTVLQSFFSFFRLAAIAFVYFLVSRQPSIGMGVFVAYISTFLIFQSSMVNLMKVVGILPEMLPVMHNVRPILQAVPEESASKTIPKDLDGSISFHHVSFQYEIYGRSVINDLSLYIKPGESVGIVGSSGSGKSTLLKLMLGLYPASSGKIYFGGYDLDTIDTSYLRQTMGVVMQHGEFIVGDILTNVTGGDTRISMQAVEEALEQVGLTSAISSWPQGIYTPLEHNTQRLTDGQKQQLLIARALVKHPGYLFFDEATSRLDYVQQMQITKALAGLSATKVIIAQRLATVRNCDRIIMLDQGKVVDQGTFGEILGRDERLRHALRENE